MDRPEAEDEMVAADDARLLQRDPQQAAQQQAAPLRPRLRSCGCHGCLAVLTITKALLVLVLPLSISFLLAPAGYGAAASLTLLLTALVTLLLCLARRKDATVRWLYAYAVGYWVGFRGLSHVLAACIPGVCGLPCGWRTYAHTLWYVQGVGVKGRAALTIDDCPGDDPARFAELLDVLKRHDVRATLFVITDRCTNPEQRALLERAVAEGHELANHMPADRSYMCDDAETFAGELRKAKAVIADIVSSAAVAAGRDDAGSAIDRVSRFVPPPWFRAPKAQLSEAMMPALESEGYHHVLGDVHSNDHEFRWRSEGVRLTDYHVDYILRTTHSSGGSIIIVHCPSGWLPNATEIVEKTIVGLKGRKQGAVRLVTVTDLVAAGASASDYSQSNERR
jgi:peptidoglycan/xylan/chitin deacetylase (PgdA/CDA1 family)